VWVCGRLLLCFFAYITQLTQCACCGGRFFNSSIQCTLAHSRPHSHLGGCFCSLLSRTLSRSRSRRSLLLSPVGASDAHSPQSRHSVSVFSPSHSYSHSPKTAFGLISRLFGFPLSRAPWLPLFWVSLAGWFAFDFSRCRRCLPARAFVCVCVWVRSVSCILVRNALRSLFVWAPRCKVVKSPSARGNSQRDGKREKRNAINRESGSAPEGEGVIIKRNGIM